MVMTTKRTGIKFNRDNLMALAEGRKTQIRRPVEQDWGAEEWHRSDDDPAVWFPCDYPTQNGQPYQCGEPVTCEYGKPGDILEVLNAAGADTGGRIRITDIRVERIKSISRADCIKEGLHLTMRNDADSKDRFKWRWQEIYPGSWERNDWVWVIEFERIGT